MKREKLNWRGGLYSRRIDRCTLSRCWYPRHVILIAAKDLWQCSGATLFTAPRDPFRSPSSSDGPSRFGVPNVIHTPRFVFSLPTLAPWLLEVASFCGINAGPPGKAVRLPQRCKSVVAAFEARGGFFYSSPRSFIFSLGVARASRPRRPSNTAGGKRNAAVPPLSPRRRRCRRGPGPFVAAGVDGGTTPPSSVGGVISGMSMTGGVSRAAVFCYPSPAGRRARPGDHAARLCRPSCRRRAATIPTLPSRKSLTVMGPLFARLTSHTNVRLEALRVCQRRGPARSPLPICPFETRSRLEVAEVLGLDQACAFRVASARRRRRSRSSARVAAVFGRRGRRLSRCRRR